MQLYCTPQGGMPCPATQRLPSAACSRGLEPVATWAETPLCHVIQAARADGRLCARTLPRATRACVLTRANDPPSHRPTGTAPPRHHSPYTNPTLQLGSLVALLPPAPNLLLPPAAPLAVIALDLLAARVLAAPPAPARRRRLLLAGTLVQGARAARGCCVRRLALQPQQALELVSQPVPEPRPRLWQRGVAGGQAGMSQGSGRRQREWRPQAGRQQAPRSVLQASLTPKPLVRAILPTHTPTASLPCRASAPHSEAREGGGHGWEGGGPEGGCPRTLVTRVRRTWPCGSSPSLRYVSSPISTSYTSASPASSRSLSCRRREGGAGV